MLVFGCTRESAVQVDLDLDKCFPFAATNATTLPVSQNCQACRRLTHLLSASTFRPSACLLICETSTIEFVPDALVTIHSEPQFRRYIDSWATCEPLTKNSNHHRTAIRRCCRGCVGKLPSFGTFPSSSGVVTYI